MLYKYIIVIIIIIIIIIIKTIYKIVVAQHLRMLQGESHVRPWLGLFISALHLYVTFR